MSPGFFPHTVSCTAKHQQNLIGSQGIVYITYLNIYRSLITITFDQKHIKYVQVTIFIPPPAPLAFRNCTHIWQLAVLHTFNINVN